MKASWLSCTEKGCLGFMRAPPWPERGAETERGLWANSVNAVCALGSQQSRPHSMTGYIFPYLVRDPAFPVGERGSGGKETGVQLQCQGMRGRIPGLQQGQLEAILEVMPGNWWDWLG